MLELRQEIERKDEVCNELKVRLQKREELNRKFNQDNKEIRKKINLKEGKENKLISEPTVFVY